MNVGDVIRAAEVLSDEQCDSTIWLQFINSCLDDLTPVAKIYREKTGIVVPLSGGAGEIDLNSDPDLSLVHEVLVVRANGKKLRDLPPGDNVSAGYKMSSRKLLLQGLSGSSATCDVGYYSRLKYVSGQAEDLESVAGLPSEYHRLVVLFCSAKAQQKEEELDDKNDFFNEYLLGKQQMALQRALEMEPYRAKYMRQAAQQ